MQLHCLYGLTVQHIRISTVGNGEYMRRHFQSSFTAIHIDNSRCVNRKTSIRIYGNTKETGVGLEERRKITTKIWIYYFYVHLSNRYSCKFLDLIWRMQTALHGTLIPSPVIRRNFQGNGSTMYHTKLIWRIHISSVFLKCIWSNVFASRYLRKWVDGSIGL